MRNIIKAIGFASSYIGMKTGINLRKEETKPSHESSNRSNKLKVPTIVAVILWCIVLSFLILALRNCTPHFIKSNPVKETVARDTLQFINSSDQSLVCGHFSYDDGYYPEEGINYPVYPTPVINYSLGEFFVKPKPGSGYAKTISADGVEHELVCRTCH